MMTPMTKSVTSIWGQLRTSFLFQNLPFATSAFEREPSYVFNIPNWMALGAASSTRYQNVGSVGVIPLDLGFWVSTFALLLVQTVINITVAAVTFRFIVQSSNQSTRYMVGYGIIVPFLILLPPYLYTVIGFQNLALMLCLCGAVGNLLTLRVVEATHQMLPTYASKSLGMLVLYFSATLQIRFDPKTQQPVLLTRKILWAKLYGFLSVFCQTSLLYSILLPYDFQVFPQRDISVSNASDVFNLYYWGNLANALLMASLTSLVLDGGASGLGLIMSLCTGYTMETFSDAPLTQSTSPSDFWGNRWDRPVESALRRGCFRPLRNAGYSRNMAAFGTFVVSGLIHEYVLWLMSLRQGPPNNPQGQPYVPSWGNQFLFFLWNGIVLLLERRWTRHPLLQWMQEHLPKPVRTAFVLLTVLPIAHLFTDEYIRSCFFGDAAWGFPLFVYRKPLSAA